MRLQFPLYDPAWGRRAGRSAAGLSGLRWPLAVAGAAILLAGCLPGPDYKAPRIELPARYARLAPAPVVGADLRSWWTGFKDPVLDALIARGLAGSPTVAQAAARLREAEALLRRAGNMVSGSASESQVNGTGVDTRNSSVGLSFGLFGGQRRAAEAAFDRVQAAGYGVQNSRLTLLSTLAQAYVDLRYYQASYAQQQMDLASRKQTLSQIEVLLKSGQVTRLDELRSQALVAETEASLPQTSANIARQVNRIATLIGTPAGAVGIDLAYSGRQPSPRFSGPIGVPADLVRRRPDIAGAERSYAAAVADIGTAVGARYPSLSLTGQIIAPRVSGYATSSTLTTGLILPLFDQPALAAGVYVARARADQAYQAWRGTVLQAVEDVQSALAEVAGARQAVVGARRAVALNTEALSLSRQMLEGFGEVTVLDVLDRERAVADSRATLAQNQRDYADSAIALYVALGLGPDEAAGQGGQ